MRRAMPVTAGASSPSPDHSCDALRTTGECVIAISASPPPRHRGSTPPSEFHHRGDGTLSTNASTVDFRDRMTKWRYLTR
jgi:hypothetical protein